MYYNYCIQLLFWGLLKFKNSSYKFKLLISIRKRHFYPELYSNAPATRTRYCVTQRQSHVETVTLTSCCSCIGSFKLPCVVMMSLHSLNSFV